MIELTSGDGRSFSAYRAEPTEAPKGAVVVLPDVYGVTPHLQKEVEGFAAEGYVAIAPALAPQEGESDGPSVTTALQDIQATVDSVKGVGKVAIVGYDWGGYLAYVSANRLSDVACAIGYYPAGISEERWVKRKIPTLLHLPENDPSLPIEEIIQFRAQRPDVSAFSYPEARNGFNFDAAESFNEAAAQSARERTLFWISQYVEGQKPIALKNSGSYAQAKVDKKKKKGGDDMGPPDA
ncbi:dienelactone hydrolase family protein [Methylocystis sp. SC2]|uniref:dienelactone hydrolase family protein n=1 Tax=Methylocystis sp. (strain SC2) TaxID=187303 RepID=UPI00027AECB5|nr:dienelactone hydrolase family protein [Methylocystis sp. SC2]CCJ08110.1 Dienelactone hydrolase [Methylocystis sp. SC2]